MKTMKDYQLSEAQTFEEFFVPGDIVGKDVVENFRNVLPPITDYSYLMQMGEPYSFVDGKSTYMTFSNEPEGWVYRGNCHKGEKENPFTKWLNRFLDEKGYDLSEEFETENNDGIKMIFSYENVINSIKNTTEQEQNEIKNMLVMLDFNSADIKDYLRHLSKALIPSRKMVEKLESIYGESIDLEMENKEQEEYKIVKRENTREFGYMMLDRLRTDCEYFLRNGYVKNLYYKDVDKHIEEMKKIYNSFSEGEKPEWLSMEEIENYKIQMMEMLEEHEMESSKKRKEYNFEVVQEKEIRNMNKYESVIIINASKSEEEINKTVDKFKNIMEGFSDREITIDNIGERKLAYEIQHNKTGYYTVFNFYAKPENIAELERNYRIDDNVMKFIVIRQEEKEMDETQDEEEEEEQ